MTKKFKMITPAEARKLAYAGTSHNFEKELSRINDTIKKEASQGCKFALVYEIPDMLHEELRKYLYDLGYSVRIDNFNDGSTVKFAIYWD